MDHKDALKYLNKHFVYRTDKDMFGVPEVVRVMKTGAYEGDCEDYALTLLWLISDGKIWRFCWLLLSWQAGLIHYRHRESREQHVGLKYKGQYADNIIKYWNDGGSLELKGYKSMFRWPFVFLMLKILVSLPFLIFKK